MAKSQVKKDIQTERITQDNIIFSYLSALRFGLKDDIRKQIYGEVDKVTMDDVKKFHQAHFSGKPYTYAIVASESKLPESELSKIGEVKKISLEELFGY